MSPRRQWGPAFDAFWVRVVRVISDLVTYVTKLAAVVLSVNEALIRQQPIRPIVFGIAALMIAGVQGLESFLDRLLGR